MNTIDIYGVRFLRCDKTDCKWNVGYTPNDRNRSGLEFTTRRDRLNIGIRVCNFSCTALALGKTIGSQCPHKEEVSKILAEDSDFTSSFWGNLNPDVARRALSMDLEQG